MIEAILGCSVAIALTMVTTGLTSLFKEWFYTKSIAEPNIHEPALPITADPARFVSGSQNRMRSKVAVEKLYCYVFSYFASYLAFYIPLNMHDKLQHPTLNLLDSRLAIDFAVDLQHLSVICAILGVFTFAPLWKVSQCIASVIGNIAFRFTAVNERKYLSFTVLSMVILAVFIAGNISWMLNADAVWFESIKLSLIFCFFYILCLADEPN